MSTFILEKGKKKTKQIGEIISARVWDLDI